MQFGNIVIASGNGSATLARRMKLTEQQSAMLSLSNPPPSHAKPGWEDL